MGRTEADFMIDGVDFMFDEELSAHTSMRIGGTARFFYEVSSPGELSSILRSARKKKVYVCFLGGGTNIVFSDMGIFGLVIKFSKMNKIKRVDDNTLFAEAGVSTGKFLDYCVKNGCGGAEFLAGIPGNMGGAFCMNSGSMGGEMSDIVVGASVCKMNGNIIELKPGDISFNYRQCFYGGGGVLGVYVRLESVSTEEIGARIQRNLEKRKKNQPVGVFTSGSIFKNPPGFSAGEIIDRLGFKGFAVGGAMVSDSHANFIINKGKASSRDVRRLIWEIGSTVSSKLGIDMELEVRLIGRK